MAPLRGTIAGSDELLEQARQLELDIAAEDERSRQEFVSALGTLRRIGGRASSGSDFEEQVARVLTGHEDWVVSRQPRTRRSRVSPDFLVADGDTRVIVEAKSFDGRGWRLGELERRMVEALEVYRASRGYVVVPDGTKPRKSLSDPRIAVLTLSELARELHHVN